MYGRTLSLLRRDHLREKLVVTTPPPVATCLDKIRTITDDFSQSFLTLKHVYSRYRRRTRPPLRVYIRINKKIKKLKFSSQWGPEVWVVLGEPEISRKGTSPRFRKSGKTVTSSVKKVDVYKNTLIVKGEEKSSLDTNKWRIGKSTI